jgi:hypothetical protein
MSGDAAQPAADLLHHHQEGNGEKDGPAERIAILCADLGIGRDAARIVVRGTGDQTRPELPDDRARTRQAAQARPQPCVDQDRRVGPVRTRRDRIDQRWRGGSLLVGDVLIPLPILPSGTAGA